MSLTILTYLPTIGYLGFIIIAFVWLHLFTLYHQSRQAYLPLPLRDRITIIRPPSWPETFALGLIIAIAWFSLILCLALFLTRSYDASAFAAALLQVLTAKY